MKAFARGIIESHGRDQRRKRLQEITGVEALESLLHRSAYQTRMVPGLAASFADGFENNRTANQSDDAENCSKAPNLAKPFFEKTQAPDRATV
jgi:hypothetical protein